MASYQIPAIEQFDFRNPDGWPKWIRRFERFRQASGIATQSPESQVNTLVYSMGPKADDIFQSFGLSTENAKKYDVVKKKFDDHFVKRRNVIFEQAKFNSRKQEDGESVESFITDVYSLAEHCGYGTLHDEMVRDRIVVGILDNTLSEKLQLDPELTVDKAVTRARQSEAVKKQQATVRGREQDESPIEVIKGGRRQPRQTPTKWMPQTQTPTYQTPQQPAKRGIGTYTHRLAGAAGCSRCGRTPSHGRAQCPAKDAVCHRCNKLGHYQTLCKTKLETIKLVEEEYEEYDEDDEQFLGIVKSDVLIINSTGAPWTVITSLNKRDIEFKIDTGADVTVIPESQYCKEQDGPLIPTKRILTGAGRNPLGVRGRFTGVLRVNGKTLSQDIYVVSELRTPLLGRPAIEGLNLVSRIQPVQTESVVEMFPSVFQGLGRLKDSYAIKLGSDVKPFALTAPRRIALPLLPKVKEELQRMEDLNVISKVEQPTEWWVGMVVVPKPNGQVRICVDLTK